MPEGSFLMTSATNMDEPTSTTESLGKDIDHYTTTDQTTTGITQNKKSDVSVVVVDSKLSIYLSAASLAMSVALPVVICTFVLVVVLFCVHKRKAKES